jgi:hypothetical protein
MYICALQDAGRRLIWITPCKPQAQLGVETAPSLAHCIRMQRRIALECSDALHWNAATHCIGMHRRIALECADALLCKVQKKSKIIN